MRLERLRDMFVCDYCRTETLPPMGEDGVRVLTETKFDCPACAHHLWEATLEGHDLLYCTHCRGMLVAMSGFMNLVTLLRAIRAQPAMIVAPRDASNGTVERRCPRCSGAMQNHPYGGPGNVFLDTCEACEVNWLDKQEIQKIAAAADPTYSSAVL
ncbi:MAG: hypothetical protein RL328_2794 [Acidobacteriota bacterium]|jgi:Zn-finger nucleic acid-binding protein